MANTASVILRDDFFRLSGAIVTDPSAFSGFPASRLRDDRDYLAWKNASGPTTRDYDVDLGTGGGGTPGALKPDTLFIGGHNLGSVPCVVEVYEGAAFPPATLVTTFSPTTDHTIFRYSTTAWTSKRYHRVRFVSAPAATQVSEIMLGRGIVFPQGINWQGFDPQQEKSMGRLVKNQGGAVMRSVFFYAERTQNLSFSTIINSFVQGDTNPTGFRYWWENYGSKGFPFAWHWNAHFTGDANLATFERDALWAVADLEAGISRPLATPLDVGYRDLALTVVGQRRP